jgi:hypothetical protein
LLKPYLTVKEKPTNQGKVPNKKTVETMVMADREEELETFDNLNDLFANWDSLKNEDKDNIRKSSKPLDVETKREILSRLLEESQGIICTETNATDSQDFLYGKDGMPS